ncbi:hypothetical protein C8A05DRAFT_48399 [Staphylotrichum tortipilum]|uniref:ceramidase n=1 Tax=Staphylotrichum tortipilum TaxID=2831512 RepID=A0AAN6MAS2_9PEZI|nr:hypothetical protein C8A05DRAFT_48399 [Staphylotrichum longicolle]
MEYFNFGDTPPLFTINLSTPPSHRYDHVAAALRPALSTIDFAALFSETIALLLPENTPPRLLQSITTCICALSRVFLRRLYSATETEEIRGISRATGLPLDLLISFNIGLDLLMGCTSGGVLMSASPSAPARMVHFRTLDWDMDELRRLVVELEFVGVEGGPAVARTVGYFGYVGVLTGVRRGLSLGLNFRAGEAGRGGWGRWRVGWHLWMVMLGWRRGVASVLRGYLLGDEDEAWRAGKRRKRERRGRGYVELNNYGDGEGRVAAIDDILIDLAHSPSTAAYLILCTPSTVYSVEKGHRTASVQSSDQFLTTCNHDLVDEPDPARIHAAAQNVASQGMAEIMDESVERKQAVEQVWKQRLRLRRRLRSRRETRGDSDAVDLDDVLHMVGQESISYGGTHYAVVMDPAHGDILWRRVYRTADLRDKDQDTDPDTR